MADDPLAGVAACLDRYEECESIYFKAFRESNDALDAAALAILESADEDGRKKLARLLYWHKADLNVDWIADLLGVTRVGVRTLAGTVDSPRRCRECGETIHYQKKSRSDGGIYEHPECQSARWKRHKEEDDARQERKRLEAEHAAARLAELKAMPYRDYLRTPEWRETRYRALRAAWHRCKLCNTKDRTIDVHHRSYNRLGEETDADIIALCRSCHQTFHKNRRLSHAGG